ATDALVGTATGTSLAVTGLTAATAYQFYVQAFDAAGNTSAASPPVSVTTTSAGGGGSCQVTYTTSDWGTGFTANVTVRNTGPAAINGWTLGFTFPGATQRVGQGWSATWSQTGAAVTATNASYNGALPAGASTGIGFNGTYSGSNPRPTGFTLNGAACTVA
ncbi:MAG TPA: cellulose binding domain-containing protein, partial [Pilimelia sp.]|nr:cellulose binding domain-containing protein [Pilimelia sp.]